MLLTWLDLDLDLELELELDVYCTTDTALALVFTCDTERIFTIEWGECVQQNYDKDGKGKGKKKVHQYIHIPYYYLHCCGHKNCTNVLKGLITLTALQQIPKRIPVPTKRGDLHKKGRPKKTNFALLFSRLGVKFLTCQLINSPLLTSHSSDSCSATPCPIFMLSLKSSDQGLHNSDENGPRYPIMMRERGRGTGTGQIFSRPLDYTVWRHMDSLMEVCGVW